MIWWLQKATRCSFYSTDNGKTNVTLSAKRKPNMFKIQKLYRQYVDDIAELMTDYAQQKYTKNEFFEELLYALNPDANNVKKDMKILKRFDKYNFPIKDLTVKVYPNDQE